MVAVCLLGCTDEGGKKDGNQTKAKTEKRVSAKKKAKFKSPYPIDNLPAETVVVTVNGQGITQQEYVDWLRVKGKMVLLKKKRKAKSFDIGEYTKAIIENRTRVHWELIRCELIRQYAETNGLLVTESALTKSWDKMSNLVSRASTAFPRPLPAEAARERKVFEKIARMSVLDELCLRHSATNNLTTVTDAEIDAQLKWIDEWNKTADQKDAESIAKAKKAKQEILSGVPFAEAAKKYSEVAPNEGEDWETFELDEFQADEPLAQWLVTAKQGDISEPIELEDGYSIIGVRQILEETPEEKDERPVKSYELVRCTFHSYEKIEVPTDRELFRKEMLAARREFAFQELGVKVMENAKIDYPKGTKIFEIPQKKSVRHQKQKKAYNNKEGGRTAVTNDMNAASAVKGSKD